MHAQLPLINSTNVRNAMMLAWTRVQVARRPRRSRPSARSTRRCASSSRRRASRTRSASASCSPPARATTVNAPLRAPRGVALRPRRPARGDPLARLGRARRAVPPLRARAGRGRLPGDRVRPRRARPQRGRTKPRWCTSSATSRPWRRPRGEGHAHRGRHRPLAGRRRARRRGSSATRQRLRVVLIAPPHSVERYSGYFARMLGLPERLRREMQARIERRLGIAWSEFELPQCRGRHRRARAGDPRRRRPRGLDRAAASPSPAPGRTRASCAPPASAIARSCAIRRRGRRRDRLPHATKCASPRRPRPTKAPPSPRPPRCSRRRP